jgi:diguanylate cyclase (GGDEF)-like protein
MLPGPPPRLLELIQFAWSRDASVQKMGTMVAEDPGLSQCVLGYVNSRTLGLGSRVDSAMRATLLLGSKAVGSIAICHAAQLGVEAAGIEAPIGSQLLEDCVRRAAAARAVARHFPQITPDLAIAVGFCLELGRAAPFIRDHGRSMWWDSLRSPRGPARLEKEKELLGSTHVEDFEAATIGWELPREIRRPVTEHHDADPDGGRPDRLVQVARLADVIAEVYTASDLGQALAEATERLSRDLRLSPAQADELIQNVATDTEDLAGVFGLVVRPQERLDNILEAAGAALDALDRGELLRRMEQMEAQRDAMERELGELRLRMREMEGEDALTHLPNRSRYFSALRKEVTASRRMGSELSVILVDIDRLGEHNDRWGQEVGDEILCNIGRMLGRMTRETDFVARIEGDCFGVVMAHTGVAGGRVLAERVRAAVEALKLDLGGNRVLISATVAGLTMSPEENVDAEAFHRRTELHLHRIKGGNRASWAA